MWNSVFLLGSDLHWLTGVSISNKYITDDTCYILGALAFICTHMSYMYITALSIEVAYKLINPLQIAYKERLILYHIIICLTVLLMLITLIIIGEPGNSVIDTCYIKEGTDARIFFLVPNYILLVIIVCSLSISIYQMI